ncbi:hypothetical protein Pelo_896 [Pelomyxa schiedti]|nr:hypothetical protein Pelo_896 [Pelomyxa schiedti]
MEDTDSEYVTDSDEELHGSDEGAADDEDTDPQRGASHSGGRGSKGPGPGAATSTTTTSSTTQAAATGARGPQGVQREAAEGWGGQGRVRPDDMFITCKAVEGTPAPHSKEAIQHDADRVYNAVCASGNLPTYLDGGSKINISLEYVCPSLNDRYSFQPSPELIEYFFQHLTTDYGLIKTDDTPRLFQRVLSDFFQPFHFDQFHKPLIQEKYIASVLEDTPADLLRRLRFYTHNFDITAAITSKDKIGSSSQTSKQHTPHLRGPQQKSVVVAPPTSTQPRETPAQQKLPRPPQYAVRHAMSTDQEHPVKSKSASSTFSDLMNTLTELDKKDDETLAEMNEAFGQVSDTQTQAVKNMLDANSKAIDALQQSSAKAATIVTKTTTHMKTSNQAKTTVLKTLLQQFYKP